MTHSELIHSLFTAGLPSLGFQARPETLSAAAVLRAVAAIAEHPSLPRAPAPERRILLEGAALLWHDRWEEAHELAQAREGRPDFDLLHAIGHRREGDYANANYWFSGAGKHPSYALIGACFVEPFYASAEAAAAESAPGSANPMPGKFLSPDWSPTAFVSAVKRQAGKPGGEEEMLMRIQAAESQALAEWILRSC